MATLDIRNADEAIAEILFSDYSSLEYVSTKELFLKDRQDDVVSIYFNDIDNLIKALHKAKELWSK